MHTKNKKNVIFRRYFSKIIIILFAFYVKKCTFAKVFCKQVTDNIVK